jgi:type IV secretory pathway VirB10-like protein
MKKKVFLTTVFALVFGCFVSYADVSPRHKGANKQKIERYEIKSGKKDKKQEVNHVSSKPHKPVAHKPAPKPHKPVAYKKHKPAPKPCHLKHRHDNHCHRPVVVHHNTVAPTVTGVVTTAAILGMIAAIAD